MQSQRPDLILLDVMMPGMNGFEVCRSLKDNANTCLIPVVIMTALGQTEDRIKGIEAGADDFLTKPVNRDELLARIRTSLRLKRAIDQQVSLLQNVQEHLVKFVPQSVTRLITANPETPELEKKEQDVSVLFVDISGYARLSELLPREDMNLIIERYFSSFWIVFIPTRRYQRDCRHGLMVIFADADPQHHARKAVQAALEMVQRVAPLMPEPGAWGLSPSILGLIRAWRWWAPRNCRVPPDALDLHRLRIGDQYRRQAATLGEGGWSSSAGDSPAYASPGAFACKKIGQRQLKNISEGMLVIASREKWIVTRNA